MDNKRKRNHRSEIEILLKSKRRCCLCFGLNRDLNEKRGQIAHLDQDRTNDKPDNLAFLCLEHHDQYDSTTSQAKSIQISEIKAYREKLYKLYEDGEVSIDEQPATSLKKMKSNPVNVKQLNTWLSDKPHKCNFCDYSFSLMPDIEEGKAYFINQVICPKCGNVDEVCRFYEG